MLQIRKLVMDAVHSGVRDVFQFFEPNFLNNCELSKLRFLRRRLNEMPLQVASACLGMIMDEASGARDNIQRKFWCQAPVRP